MKRFDKPLLGFLSTSEIQAILDAPPTDRCSGQRDRIMFATLLQAVQSPRIKQTRYRPTDRLLAFLRSGDVGSPRVNGSTNASSAAFSPGCV